MVSTKLCLQFLIVAFVGYTTSAQQYTCLTDGEKETTTCKLINECYVIYNTKSGTTNYGCLIKMTNSQRNYCAKNPHMCITCTGNNCNTKDLMKMCITCTSKEDERCTTDPQQLAKTSVRPCNGDCITHVLPDGTNTRGCMKPTDDCDDMKCQECKGNLCNVDVFPRNRRVCNAKDDAKEVCLKPQDTCLSILNAQGDAIKLGCTSNLFKNQNLKKMCEKKPERCPTCDKNECNGDAKKHECVSCDENDENCLDDPEKVETKTKCMGKCYLDIDGDKVKRGCTDTYKCDKETCLECEEEICTSEMCYA
ncbi:uncharacterized protein LOC113363732 isoform X1 [Ctenocephalides felis]|uniref:uncharacterized protein LOC113363732 isoform X1 n=1 Tax=Ctenocephalides felis TaxID=7515 RepID=UPI000E6E2F41|nr:uncharacterized protein LOC113363732 isoform X1 [Ctenocephalides felis]